MPDMCIGREMLNLCKCGCTEAEHEEQVDILASVFPHPGDPIARWTWKRGKCCGRRLLPLDPEHIRPEFVPCECEEFEPVFKNMCGGF